MASLELRLMVNNEEPIDLDAIRQRISRRQIDEETLLELAERLRREIAGKDAELAELKGQIAGYRQHLRFVVKGLERLQRASGQETETRRFDDTH